MSCTEISTREGRTAPDSVIVGRTAGLAVRSELRRLRIHAVELAYGLGRWDDALTELEAAGRPNAGRTALEHGVAALIHGHRDDWRQAEAHLEQLTRQIGAARTLARQVDSGAVPVAALALHSERLGRPQRALELLARVLEPDAGERMPHRYKLLPTTVRLALEVGDRRLARKAAEISAQEAYRVSALHAEAAADWCEGLVRGDPAAVVAAADRFRDGTLPLESGNALEDAAVLQARSGDGTAARAALGAAQAMYGVVGAKWDARRAAARLRANGVRLGARGPRKRPHYGWHSLTAMEREVARLAADGHPNPDIAAYLHMSRRTVESHVSHILTKLCIASRREIKDFIQGDA